MGSQSKSVVQLGQSECGRHSEGLVVCRVGESGANLSSSRPLFLNRKKKREKKSGVVVLVLGRASGSLFFCFVSMWLKPSQVTSKSFREFEPRKPSAARHHELLRPGATFICFVGNE